MEALVSLLLNLTTTIQVYNMADENKKKTLGSVLFGSDTNNIVSNATRVGKFVTPASQSELLKRQQAGQGTKGTTVGDNSGTGVNAPSTPSAPPSITSPTQTPSSPPSETPKTTISQSIGNTTFREFKPEVGPRSGIGNSNDLVPTSLQNSTANKTTLNINDGIGGVGSIVSDRSLSSNQIDNLSKTVAFNAANPNTNANTNTSAPSLGNRDELARKLEFAIANDNQREQAIYSKLLQNFDDNATARIGQQVSANAASNRTNSTLGLAQQRLDISQQNKEQALQNDTLKQISDEFTKNPIFSPGQAANVFKTRLGTVPDANTVKNIIGLSGKENLDNFTKALDTGDKLTIGKYLLEDSGFDQETVASFLDTLK